jgi:hypothetical protein
MPSTTNGSQSGRPSLRPPEYWTETIGLTGSRSRPQIWRPFGEIEATRPVFLLAARDRGVHWADGRGVTGSRLLEPSERPNPGILRWRNHDP